MDTRVRHTCTFCVCVYTLNGRFYFAINKSKTNLRDNYVKVVHVESLLAYVCRV